MSSSSSQQTTSKEESVEDVFATNFFGNPVPRILDDLYNIAHQIICDAYDNFETSILQYICRENKTITKEELRELDNKIHDAVESLVQLSIESLNYQFDVLERYAIDNCFSMPDLPKECQDIYCKMVTKDIMKPKQSSPTTLEEQELHSDEETMSILSQIHQVQNQLIQSHDELCKDLHQSRQLLEQRREINKQIIYYSTHSKKLEFIKEKLEQLSTGLDQTIHTLIQEGLTLHNQYRLSDQEYRSFFNVSTNKDTEVAQSLVQLQGVNFINKSKSSSNKL